MYSSKRNAKRNRRSSPQRLLIVVALIGTILVLRLPATPKHIVSQLLNSYNHRLYVLDPRGRTEQAEVLVLQADTGQLMKTIPAGWGANIALSPNGGLLFLISRPHVESNSYKLLVMDAATGNILDSQDVSDRHDYTTLVPPSDIKVSPDGAFVYILKRHSIPITAQEGAASIDQYSTAIYDVKQHKFSSNISVPGDCLRTHAVVSSSALHVLCSARNEVISFRSTDGGFDSRARNISLPGPPRFLVGEISRTSAITTTVHPAFVGGVSSVDGAMLTVATSYMRFFQIDTLTEQLVRDKQVRDDEWAMPDTLLASPDGTRLYVAVGPISQLNRAPGVHEILVTDAQTLAQLSTIQITDAFHSLSMSKDGHFLYAVSPETSSIHVVGTNENREIRAFTGVGITPARVEAGP
jgi:DNA-binding beta-propeller fold protein YncE